MRRDEANALLARTVQLRMRSVPQPTLLPRARASGGEGPREAPGWGVFPRTRIPLTPDHFPPFAALMGGGEKQRCNVGKET
jgi:hypothetical protein